MLEFKSLDASRRPEILGYAVAALAIVLAIINLVDPIQPLRLLLLVVVASYVVWVTATQRRSAEPLRRAAEALHRTDEALRGETIERKRAEEELRALRLVIDTIPVMAWIVLPNGKLEFLNRRWLEYTGLSLQKAIERPVDTVHPEDLPKILETWNESMVTGEPYEEEMRLRRSDGEYRWFLVRSASLRDARGKIVRWYGTSTDIEDRKRAEEALRQSEERFAAFMDNLPGYAWMKDLQGRYVYINQMVRGLPGYESLGKTDAQIWPADLAAEYRANDQRVIAAKKPLHTVEHYLHEGKRRHMLGSKFPIFDKDRAVALVGGAGVDITERIEAEEALRESAERLQQISRRLLAVQEEERRHLARELHDEFGQLLATVTVQLHAAKRVCSEAAQASLEQCIALLQRAGDQVRSLALELRPAMLDTAGLDSTLRWLAEQHQQRTGVAVEVVGHLNDVPGNQAIAGFRMVQEALTNIVRHAQAQRVWIELSQTEGSLELVVRDDGVGFDVTKTLAQAVGRGHLGLLGMKERAQILGGSLEVDSEPGRGTLVRISLPVAEATPEPAEGVT